MVRGVSEIGRGDLRQGMTMASEDVVGVVARGIYAEVMRVSATPENPPVFFDMLPADARDFLRKQARTGLERLRHNVTDGMVAAGTELGDDPAEIFCAMLDYALAKDMN